MSLYLTNINLPWEWPWNANDNMNNVLHLHFLDPNNLTDEMDQLENQIRYYRVFIFLSIDPIDSEQQTSTFSMLRDLTDSKDLIVCYNARNVSIFIDSIDANEESSLKLVYVVNRDTNYGQIDLFDRTFGEFERTQSIVIQRISHSDKSLHGVDFYTHFNPKVFWMHFYYMHLNNTSINMTWIDNTESSPFETKRHCALQPADYYKEVASKYQCTQNQNP